jgi:hypothetical protein
MTGNNLTNASLLVAEIKQTVRKVGLSGVAGGINRHRGL